MEEEKHVLTKMHILYAQVCSSGTWEEAEEYIRSNYPSGTMNNWSKAEDERYKPVTCNDDHTRKHYVFQC